MKTKFFVLAVMLLAASLTSICQADAVQELRDEIRPNSLPETKAALDPKPGLLPKNPLLLHEAIRTRDEKGVLLVLINGAPVNVRDKDGNTPLHLAITQNALAAVNNSSSRDYFLVRLLINAGAYVSVRNNNGETPLSHAIMNVSGGVNEDTVQFLLSSGAEPDIFTAAFLGDVKMAAWLLKEHPELAKANFEKKASFGKWKSVGKTPLHVAAERNHLAVAELLLKNGADTEAPAQRHYFATPFGMAHTKEMKELLLKYGARGF
jgi:ankyrin repeat protein